MFFIYSVCIAQFSYTHKISYNNFEFKTKDWEALVLENTISWIKNNTKENEKILMFPEYTMPLLMINREPDYVFYALHDINIQTFGDEYIKNRILNENYKYIIDTSFYQSTHFGAKAYKIIDKGNYIETLLKDEYKKYHQLLINGDIITIYKRITH